MTDQTETLRDLLEEWRTAARSARRIQEDADQGYAVGLEYAIFGLNEVLEATPPAAGLDVERLARAYAEAGYGPVLSDDEWADVADEYDALAEATDD